MRTNGDGSKRLTDKEHAAVLYSRAYARVKLYEVDKAGKDENQLQLAKEDFAECFHKDSDNHKAKRAEEKLKQRLTRSSSQWLAERIGPWLIVILSATIFMLSQASFFFGKPSVSLDPGYYAILTFGALIFMVAGIYLPQILKLKIAGIELEKSAVDQIKTQGSLGISK